MLLPFKDIDQNSILDVTFVSSLDIQLLKKDILCNLQINVDFVNWDVIFHENIFPFHNSTFLTSLGYSDTHSMQSCIIFYFLLLILPYEIHHHLILLQIHLGLQFDPYFINIITYFIFHLSITITSTFTIQFISFKFIYSCTSIHMPIFISTIK